MKNKFLLFGLLFLFLQPAYAQDILIVGNKSYKSTKSLEFKSKSSFGFDLDVIFAKNENQGIISISTHLMGNEERIKGKLIIYLDDGTVITCIDRGKYDMVDNVATTIYYLSSEEINKLKTVNINTIRFSIKCHTCTYSSDEGDYSAVNKLSNYSDEKNDCPDEIRKLFGE